MRNVALKSPALISQNSTKFQFIKIWEMPERPYNAMQNRYRDNFWRRENYSNEYETFPTFVA